MTQTASTRVHTNMTGETSFFHLIDCKNGISAVQVDGRCYMVN